MVAPKADVLELKHKPKRQHRPGLGSATLPGVDEKAARQGPGGFL
jgi:hypothetical protein